MRLLVATIALVGVGCVGWPQARDSSSPPLDEPPVPRVGPMVGFGLSLDENAGHWADARTTAAGHWQTGLGLHLRIGAMVDRNVAVVTEGSLTIPLAGDDAFVPFAGMSVVTVGAGVLAFRGSWHVSAMARYAGQRQDDSSGIARINPPIESWAAYLGELGTGYTSRRGTVDRSWSLSVFAGPMSVGGWTAGLSLTRAWTIFWLS